MSTRVLQWQVHHWRLYAGVIAGGIFGYILFGAMFFQALAAIGFMAFAVCAVVTVCAVRKAALAAKRPDYSRIASMERKVWGEAFEHAGAPAIAMSSRDVLRATRTLCLDCGSPEPVIRGRCTDCYGRWQRTR